jgi:uncharacterized membrane protein
MFCYSPVLLVLVLALGFSLGAQAGELPSSALSSSSPSTPVPGFNVPIQPTARFDPQRQPQEMPVNARGPQDEALAQADQLQRQRRREVLREALKSPMEEAPIAARQLSSQERAALRQQLRQQLQGGLK